MSKKHLLRALALFVVPPIAALVIRLIYYTNKKRFHLPSHVPQEPLIFSFWHGDLLMQPYSYFKFRQKAKIKILISDHFDGRIIAKCNRFFGFETIHGSTNRNPARALIGAIGALKSGYDIGITPDGPKGPRHEVSDGAVVMAKKSGARVVVLSAHASSYWQLDSWDKFVIPKPFGTIEFFASEPLDFSELSIGDAKIMLKEKMDELAR